MLARDVLRRAWPTGFLPIRGVRTVTNWTCCAAKSGDPKSIWINMSGVRVVLLAPSGHIEGSRPEDERPIVNVNAGDMLPDVNPTDPATWAACLADLVWAKDTSSDPLALFYRAEGTDGRWWELLTKLRGERTLRSYRYDFQTEDPAQALALARARVRAETSR